ALPELPHHGREDIQKPRLECLQRAFPDRWCVSTSGRSKLTSWSVCSCSVFVRSCSVFVLATASSDRLPLFYRRVALVALGISLVSPSRKTRLPWQFRRDTFFSLTLAFCLLSSKVKVPCPSGKVTSARRNVCG